MAHTFRKIALVTTLALGLGACDSNETVGTFIGAGLGAWLGSEIDGGSNRGVGTMLGMMGGAMIGNSIGQRLDDADRAMANRAYYQSLESTKAGTRTEWYNPDTGHRGYYEPEPAFKDEKTDRYCREFTQNVQIGGKEQTAYGRACRQPDGDWKIIETTSN